MKTIITKDSDEKRFTINIQTEKHFSITADGYHRCGCLHEEILLYKPELKPFIDLHLSDLNGLPMHAEANGWHFLAKAAGIVEPYEPDQSPEICEEIFQQHIRASREDVLKICCKIYDVHQKEGYSKARDTWREFIEEMRPRWEKEAKEALEFLKTL